MTALQAASQSVGEGYALCEETSQLSEDFLIQLFCLFPSLIKRIRLSSCAVFLLAY